MYLSTNTNTNTNTFAILRNTMDIGQCHWTDDLQLANMCYKYFYLEDHLRTALCFKKVIFGTATGYEEIFLKLSRFTRCGQLK